MPGGSIDEPLEFTLGPISESLFCKTVLLLLFLLSERFSFINLLLFPLDFLVDLFARFSNLGFTRRYPVALAVLMSPSLAILELDKTRVRELPVVAGTTRKGKGRAGQLTFVFALSQLGLLLTW